MKETVVLDILYKNGKYDIIKLNEDFQNLISTQIEGMLKGEILLIEDVNDNSHIINLTEVARITLRKKKDLQANS